MRRLFGLLAALGLLAITFPAAVAAAPPGRLETSETRLYCDLASDAGSVLLIVDASEWGASGGVQVWAPDADPMSDPPIIWSADGTATFDGSSMTGTFDLVLVDDPEKTAGSLRFTAELTPFGEELVIDDREVRDGTRLYKIDIVVQQLAVAGGLTLQLSDGSATEIDLGACDAGTMLSSYFSTSPNAYLTNTEQVFVHCQWTSELGAVDLFAVVDDYLYGSQVSIVGSDRTLFGFAGPILTATEYLATHELVDVADWSTVGSASVAATLSPSGERITDHEWADPHRFNVVGEGLTADGTLSISLDGTTVELPMNAETCSGGDVLVQVLEKIPRG